MPTEFTFDEAITEPKSFSFEEAFDNPVTERVKGAPFTEQEITLADPEYGGGLSRLASQSQPYETMQHGIPSALGITPETVPSGSEIAKSQLAKTIVGPIGGLAMKPVSTVASSVAKTGLGMADYLTSRQGISELVLSMTPLKLVVLGKWATDMAKGAGGEAGALSELVNKPDKTPEDWQEISDHTINTLAMTFGAGSLGKAGFKPIRKLVEPKTMKAIHELESQLSEAEPNKLSPDQAAAVNLGLPQRAQPEAMLPELQRTRELIDRAIQEAQSTIIVPGQTPALELLKAQGIVIEPQSRATAERIEGGGEAPYGKVSYMRGAEAPTTRRTQAVTEGERATLQKLVDEEASRGAVYDPAVLPNGITYRRPKTAPTPEEYQKQLEKEAIEKGLTQESGYYLDEPRTQALPEPEPQPQRPREGVTIVSPGTGRAIEKPIPLSALQRSRLRMALARGAPEEVILNILRLKPKEQNALSQPSTASGLEREVRSQMGEGTPLRQQGETAPVQIEEANRAATQGATDDLSLTEPATEASLAPPKTGIKPASLSEKLAALKFKADKEGQVIPDIPGQTFSLPHPDAIKQIGKQLWNDTIDVAIKLINAGKSAMEAVDAAIAHIRKNSSLEVKTSFDEAQTRANLLSALSDTKPNAQPTADPVPTISEVKPTKVVTPKEARQMERSVKLDKDVSKIKEQLDLFDQNIGEALTEGGQFLPKEMRPDVAKGKPAETRTVTSKEINQYFVNQLVTVRKGMQRLKTEMEANADTTSQMFFDTLQKRFELSFRKVQELRRASHEALYFWNEIRGEYQEIAKMAGEMPAIKQRKPIIDQIVKDLRDKNFARAGKDFVDYLRVNLFTPFSFTLDLTTNLMAVAGHTPAWMGMDLAHLITGKPITRTATALRALKLAGRNAIPFTERFRLPEDIEIGLGTAAGGEFQGLPKEVMVDFSEILRSKPELAKKLKNVDYVLGGPVRMKRAVDNFFGRFGATAELYNAAYQAGRGKKLQGDQLKAFVEEFVNNPPEEAITEAIRVGGEFKFNRQLPQWAERFASNTITKLAVEAYPRWTLQFTKWAGEMLAVDPGFFKKVKDGTATAEQTAAYLAKAATGWGALYAFNQLFYNQVDPNTMEFVTEKGDRIRLSGRQPFPELYLMTAMFRGDIPNAKAALPYTSIPFASMIGGQGGLLSPLVNTMAQSWSGNYTAEQASREMTKMVNNAIPGKSLLGLARSLYDPTVREGIGAPIPGVAGLLPTRVNPTTGEPLSPMQRVPGTNIKLPAVGGTPFPGALRIQNQIEKVLMNHGISTVRPRRTSLIEIPTEEVPKELRREYEQRVGANVKAIVGEGIQNPEWQQLDFDSRRDVLTVWLTQARAVAKAELAEKYQKSNIPEKPIPMNVRRLPPFVKQLSPVP